MLAHELLTQEDLQYCVDIRRAIHRRPELGFDLPETHALVTAELEKLGLQVRHHYAPCSAVADLKPEHAGMTLMFRADMDALPVTEKTGLPFASEIEGRMHACGHDTHTAILLTAARILTRVKDQLPCNVRFLFQPSEECEESGAKEMAENGAVDDVDYCLATHCSNNYPAGTIGINSGDSAAACDPVTIVFHGKTAHATRPQTGVDAIKMAMAAREGLQKIVDEEMEGLKHIWALGYISGGTAHNVVADRCELRFTFRYFDMARAAAVKQRGVALLERIAANFGGTVDIQWETSAPPVINAPAVAAAVCRCVSKLEGVTEVESPVSMGSEDFSHFVLRKPGAAFNYGTGNVEKYGVSSVHCNNFIPDEDGFRAPILTFVQFALDADQLN